jgi:hypothetical protein
MAGIGLLTGWGDGVAALPAETPPPFAVSGTMPDLVTVPTPALSGERFRRATRECLLGVAAVRDAAAAAGLPADRLAGDRTGLLYVSATAYAAANRTFLEDEGSTTLHFPYTAPSALPGEVAIEFGLRGGAYLHLMGGGPTALEALWYAARWLEGGGADRVLVLAVETVHEVRDLVRRARGLLRRPVVEGAVCLLLEPAIGPPLRWATATGVGRHAEAGVAAVLAAALDGTPPPLVAGAVGPGPVGRAEARILARRGLDRGRLAGVGETFALSPLIGLARGRAARPEGTVLVTAVWRDTYGAMVWPAAA